ncbi:MAG: hypothetical protein FWG34_05390 [Oscillospiraceae bacterium]|nr:hypothetical protein [Oscillospiraceae bacterium]
MKFKFKIQPFQTEAVESAVKVFAGQSKHGEARYRRDIGKGELTVFEQTDDYETGYRNADVELGPRTAAEKYPRRPDGEQHQMVGRVERGARRGFP